MSGGTPGESGSGAPEEPATRPVSVDDVLGFLRGATVRSIVDSAGPVSEPVALQRPRRGDGLAFCDGEDARALAAIEASSARVLLITTAAMSCFAHGLPGRTLVACESPRLAFVQVVERFWPDEPDAECGGAGRVHPSCEIADSAWIAPDAEIGPGCRIGAHTVIHGGARLYRGVRTGANVRIDANAVIGSPGFGFVRDPDTGWRRFPQRASVVLGDRVEVGAGACIDRGALADTLIGCGTKIDNLAYVAHNVLIGRDCLIMASSILAGSCELEDDVVVSPGAMVRDYCTVGRGAHVGMGAVVVADVPPGSVVAGVPAAPLRDTSKRN